MFSLMREKVFCLDVSIEKTLCVKCGTALPIGQPGAADWMNIYSDFEEIESKSEKS